MASRLAESQSAALRRSIRHVARRRCSACRSCQSGKFLGLARRFWNMTHTNRQSTAVCLQGPRKRQVISISRQGKGALGAYLLRHHPTGATRSRCAIFSKRVQQMRGVSSASLTIVRLSAGSSSKVRCC
ncbi:hypothetical protein BT67DRAFT_57066 [Trichocladium antarcticum]|uniref:Uncharacterized protein n=1 Tax=Trichocladium antarcticum TaxID=1450529 RepID=A0AAN6UK27_9PEZI|nr:hypothetical protein BT67DRAFT_57066 [Trichocladium antarcticum]